MVFVVCKINTDNHKNVEIVFTDICTLISFFYDQNPFIYHLGLSMCMIHNNNNIKTRTILLNNQQLTLTINLLHCLDSDCEIAACNTRKYSLYHSAITY